jgi:DNA-binding NarL/FixJ family response regulator
MCQLREHHAVNHHSISLLLVEDSPIIRDAVAETLSRNCGITIEAWAATQESAIQRLQLQPFDLLMVDIELAQGNGLEVLKWLSAQDFPHQKPVCMVLSNHAHPQYRRCAKELGAAYFFDKSMDFDHAIKAIKAEVLRLASKH